jgi:CRISPR/Cas system-associated exonuclease Cas4 (RecB family)
MNNRGALIRASEVGEYVFCARAWRLRLEGHEPHVKGRAAMEAGERWHREHGRSVRRARRLRVLAAISGLLALVIAALIVTFWLSR